MDSQILEGLQIMLIGMGVVLSFLILLVFVMMFVSRVARAIEILSPSKEATTIPSGATLPQATSAKQNDNSLIALVIAVAKNK